MSIKSMGIDGVGIKYGLTPDCDFPDFAAHLRWKWRVQNCGTCTSARPRLQNYRDIADDANYKALTSGDAICSPEDPFRDARRLKVCQKLEEELLKGWRVDSLKRGDFGHARRVQFQTRLNWDYRVVENTVKNWNKVGRLVDNHRNRSYRKVKSKEFKIGSDIGGIDRWRYHRMMKGVLG